MAVNLSPQEIKEIGKMWGTSLFTPEEFENLLSAVPLEKRLKGLKPEEQLMGLTLEERFMGLKPEEQLAGLSNEEIEACLEQRRKQNKN